MKKRKRSDSDTRLTINVGERTRAATVLRVSKSATLEIREYIEESFIPFLVRLAEQAAKDDGIRTIEERNVVRAKDWVNVALKVLR